MNAKLQVSHSEVKQQLRFLLIPAHIFGKTSSGLSGESLGHDLQTRAAGTAWEVIKSNVNKLLH